MHLLFQEVPCAEEAQLVALGDGEDFLVVFRIGGALIASHSCRVTDSLSKISGCRRFGVHRSGEGGI